ncbi:MAG: hypothetical protein JKY93_01825 [Gammaproteobacteria bacterium]|nr:hypothetical protein [Gammaproteobacteria bacterium]
MTELALTAKTIGHKHLPNGMTRIWIDVVTAEYPKTLELVILEGQPLGVVPLQYQPASYGMQAIALQESQFFETRELYEFIGSDAEYQKWCKGPNKCASSGREGYDGDRIEYAHYRGIANGSGTGIKPKFSGIPLLRSLHALQHSQGYIAVGGKDWFEQQAVDYVKEWAGEKLKKKFGYDSWNQVPPRVLFDWADDMGVAGYLPEQYKFKKETENVV